MNDKLNHVDYHWYMVRTRPRQERKLVGLLEQYKMNSKNILEVYAPTHTTVHVRRGGNEQQTPLFAGVVFVLSTQNSLMDFMKAHPHDGDVQYERKRENGERTRMRVIPEEQMRAFMDYNENYADKVIVLERPYTDYAFNAKAGEPNEIVRVIDGPLAGCEGYICRFRREKRLVFQVRGFEPGSHLTVSYPNVWDLHVVRLHNGEGDRLSVGTEKGRAVDLLVGFLQACGYGGRTGSMFYGIIGYLAVKPSLVALCKDLHKRGDVALGMRLAQMGCNEAELVINLARYEHDNPGYVEANWSKFMLRPFLTPTSGVELEAGKDEVEFRHEYFCEIIRKVDIKEEAYLHEGRTGSGTINIISQRERGHQATEQEVKEIYQAKSDIFNSLPKAEPMPGAYELLQKIKKNGLVPMVVTGSGQLSLLEKLNRSYPDVFRQELMVTAFDVKYGKPNPEPYLMALQKAHIKANEAIVVENAPLGVRAGVAAGIFTVALNTGPLPDKALLDEGADLLFPSMQAFNENWEAFYKENL